MMFDANIEKNFEPHKKYQKKRVHTTRGQHKYCIFAEINNHKD